MLSKLIGSGKGEMAGVGFNYTCLLASCPLKILIISFRLLNYQCYYRNFKLTPFPLKIICF